MQLLTHLFGFTLLVVLVQVSFGQPDEPESNIFQEEESYLLENEYDPVHGGSSTKFVIPPTASTSRYQSAETYSRPVIIVSGRNLKDQSGLQEKRIITTRSKYDDEDEESEERPVIVETKKKRKKVDQPISAYVPTAYVIGNQGGGQPVTRVRHAEPVEKDQEYGIMVVSPNKQPEQNYQLINAANYPSVNEEMVDRNTIQLYQEPQIVEALSVDGQNQIKEITADDKDESLEAQKSKLTLLFLGYEKF